MNKLFDLTGKNAVVIGGAGGLGQAITQGLIEAGAKALISDIKQDSMERAQKELLDATGFEVPIKLVDATDEAQVEALVADAVAALGGPIAILVNAQGFNSKADALDFDMSVFRKMLEANVVTLMMTAKHFGRHFKENGYGKIVNLSSVRGKIATKHAGNAGYCTTKGAVDMLTKQLASEYGQYGITVNAIGPTGTVTPMMLETYKQRAAEANMPLDDYLKEQGAGLPMRRSAMPEDLVGTAVFLSSPASDFMTGNIVYPDGGLTAIG